MNEDIKNSSDYQEKKNRVANISAWLDETLEDILECLQQIHNEENVEKKNLKIKTLMSYLNGVQDGNRFGKPNPYNNTNSPRINNEGSRVMF